MTYYPNSTVSYNGVKMKITKEDIGLGNVDNTSDKDKPISDALKDVVDRMEDAIDTANDASERANDASESAEESAETVRTYDSRLSEAEDGVAENKSNILTHDGEITTLQGKVNQLDGDITDITNDMTNMVRKVSNTVQNVNKGLTVGEVPNVSHALVTKAEVYGTNQVDNNLVHTISDEDIYGTKTFKDILVDRVSYGKNTSGSQGYMATFKLPSMNKNERYMIASFMFAGRTVACGMFTLVWDESVSYLGVREFYGNSPPPMCIASDPNGDYWLCFRMNTNNALQFFNFLMLRNSGFQTGKLEPFYGTDLVNIQTTEGWTVIRESE